MIKFFRRRLISILLIVFVVFSVAEVLANTTQKNLELIQSPIKITEAFKNISHNLNTARDREDIEQGKLGKDITPAQSKIPSNSKTTQEQDINEFAWKDFVALNWPVDCQGKPLNQLIGKAPEAPRVWELYPSPKDVFLPNGATPPSLDKLPEDKKCLGDGKGSEIEYKPNLRLAETGEVVKEEEFSEVEIASRKDLLDGYGELKPDLNIDGKTQKISLADIDAANKIRLVDREGNYVIIEIRLNPIEYNQILSNKWYDATHLIELIKSSNSFNLRCSKGYEDQEKLYCSEGYQDEGAIEIKAVLRVFNERNSAEEKARYYTTKRKIVSPDEISPEKYKILQEQAELGLIGFHIMHKTSKLGWIWSTFEHIDNAPPCKPENSPEKTRAYTLYNNECKTGNCKENWPYVKEPYLRRISNNEPKAVRDQLPSQICRSNPIRKSAQKQNEKWHNLLKTVDNSSVWQYYQLIGTEWLQHPEIPYSNKKGYHRQITPEKPLTNVALEPYAQGVSCIVCHTSAHLPGKDKSCELNAEVKMKACADFSFLMDNAQFIEQLTPNLN